MDSGALLILGVAGGVGILLVLAFYLLLRVFARASGWSALAGRYAFDLEPAGPLYPRQTVQVGAVRYRHAMDVGISPIGLYLAPAPPVLTGHQPLLIPWRNMSAARPARLYWRSAMRVDVRAESAVPVTVLSELFEQMRPHMQAPVQLPQ